MGHAQLLELAHVRRHARASLARARSDEGTRRDPRHGYFGGAVATHFRVGDVFALPLVLHVLAWVGLSSVRAPVDGQRVRLR